MDATMMTHFLIGYHNQNKMTHKSGFPEYLVSRLPFELNNYKFLKFVGQGSFSTVFAVQSNRYNRLFAAKMTHFDDSFLDSEGRLADPELCALFELDHDFIIRFYDYFVYEDYLFLILEYCNQGTLAEFLENKATKKFIDIKVFCRSIINALSYCHSQRIAHRDIKPSNIFIDSSFRPKLADFDLSSNHLNYCHTKCGSPIYAAPEIFQNGPIDPFKADVFSLGVTIYQVATYELPWTMDEVCMAKRPPVTFPPDMDVLLKALLKHMLEIDPKQRPSIDQVAQSPYFAEQMVRQTIGLKVKSGVSKSSSIFLRPIIPKQKEPQTDRLPHAIQQESSPQLMQSAAKRVLGTRRENSLSMRRSSINNLRTFS